MAKKAQGRRSVLSAYKDGQLGLLCLQQGREKKKFVYHKTRSVKLRKELQLT